MSAEARTTSTAPPPRRFGLLRDLALMIVVFIGISLWQARHVRRGAASPVEGVGLHGESLSLAALRGHPAVLHFWATWCGVCRAEEGTIAGLARDVPMLTVASSSGSASEVAATLASRGVELPTVVDPDGQLAARYGVSAFPTTLILDSRGEVAWVTVGYTTRVGLRTRLALTR